MRSPLARSGPPTRFGPTVERLWHQWGQLALMLTCVLLTRLQARARGGPGRTDKRATVLYEGFRCMPRRAYALAMSKADEYQQRAKDAEEMARGARDDAVRKSWSDLAEQWRELAAQAKRNGW